MILMFLLELLTEEFEDVLLGMAEWYDEQLINIFRKPNEFLIYKVIKLPKDKYLSEMYLFIH